MMTAGSIPLPGPASTAQHAAFPAEAAAAAAAAAGSISTTAAAHAANSPFPAATAGAEPSAELQDRLQDDLGATAMSIDTPSYARSVSMGHPGPAAGFGRGTFHMSQDLAQSMSIDGAQQAQLWGNTGAHTMGKLDISFQCA